MLVLGQMVLEWASNSSEADGYVTCVYTHVYHLCSLILSQRASVTKQIIPVMSGK